MAPLGPQDWDAIETVEVGACLPILKIGRGRGPAADSRSGPERRLAEERFLVGAVAEELCQTLHGLGVGALGG